MKEATIETLSRVQMNSNCHKSDVERLEQLQNFVRKSLGLKDTTTPVYDQICFHNGYVDFLKDFAKILSLPQRVVDNILNPRYNSNVGLPVDQSGANEKRKMMILPKVLIQKTLEWDHGCPTYRLVAIESQYGFAGIDYIAEKLEGVDSMGIERWAQTEVTEGSLVLAAIGQALLEIARDK